MSQAGLQLFTGAALQLTAGEGRTFGRADCGKEVETVSREQFRVDCSAEEVRATSLSATNPTKVLLGSGVGGVLLNKGESRLLRPGDRVLLLACDPSMWVELAIFEPGNNHSAGGGGGADSVSGRPSKRARQDQQGQQQQEQQHQQQQKQQQQQQQQPGQAPGQQGQQEPVPGTAAAAPAAATAVGGVPTVVLVLVGVQGSGKSMFCADLVAKAAGRQGGALPKQQQAAGAQLAGSLQQQQQQQPAPAQQQQGHAQQQQGPVPQPSGHPVSWVRINQDSIAGPGRRGTREQCLEAARLALLHGHSVLIDRTNVDQDQRRPFVRLAQQQGAQAHCLMLKLPKKLCMSRAAARTDHEGALQGKAVYPAINRMHTDMVGAGDPHPREGFSSVLICENEGEVAAALQAWALYSLEHPDPAAEYERLKPPPPPAPKLNTLDRFFKKKAENVGSGEEKEPSKEMAKGGGVGQAGQQQQQQQGRQVQPGRQQGESREQQVQPGRQQGESREQQAQRWQGQQGQQGQQPAAGVTAGSSGGGAPSGGKNAGGTNALQALMAVSRQQAKQGNSASPAGRTPAGAAGAAGGGGGGARQRHTFPPGVPASLVAIASNPESCRSEQPQLWFDKDCVLISDKFPKARQHWLVVARDPRLTGPLDLTTADVPLVEHMMEVARRRAVELQQADPSLRFRFGFHASPSLKQLHMHVVSQDFDSPWMKKKQHWNSFTHPDFFRDAEWALQQLRQHGRVEYSLAAAEEAKKADLRCHRCASKLATMPAIKTHIARCTHPLPMGPHYYY